MTVGIVPEWIIVNIVSFVLHILTFFLLHILKNIFIDLFLSWLPFITLLFCLLSPLYSEARSSVMEQSLRKLGVERLTKDDVQKMQWEVLEAKIGNWIHYMRIAVRLCIWFQFLIFLLEYFDTCLTKHPICFRSNFYFMQKRKSVIRFTRVMIPSGINVLQRLPQIV